MSPRDARSLSGAAASPSTDMKIGLVHNFYGSSAPSGENAAFLAEKRLLESRGHQVVEFTRDSDGIRASGWAGAVQGGAATPWNLIAARALRQLLVEARPDVVHVHNFFPLVSPAAFYVARELGIPSVFTVHNYRVFCAAAIPMREGRTCTECLDGRSVLPALRYGCYRGSRGATIPLATMIALHRRLGTWRSKVDAYIALTEFQRDVLAGAGLPADRIHVKPHFYSDAPAPRPWGAREDKVVYIGRLGPEKGLVFLLRAWSIMGERAPGLELVGDGPQRGELERLVAERGLAGRVRFVGQLDFAAAQERLAAARLMVLPSLCIEGFPMSIREAFALGVPVAGSDIGPIPHLVQEGRSGVLFAPGDAARMAEKILVTWNDVAALERMARAARAEFEDRYTESHNYERLLQIYGAAIEARRKAGSALH